MALVRTLQAPLRIGGAGKRETRTQFAALCFRRNKKRKAGFEVLLVSSLNTRRWVIPKGWPMDGMTPAAAAAQEAWEEAGVRGKVNEACVGLYSYEKWIDEELSLPCIVAVFGIEVEDLAEAYPEAGRRQRKWVTVGKAAQRVEEEELKHLLQQFHPDALR